MDVGFDQPGAEQAALGTQSGRVGLEVWYDSHDLPGGDADVGMGAVGEAGVANDEV